jgi:hypothetical protein
MAKQLIMKMGTLLLTKEHGKTLNHENGGWGNILFKIMGFFILREWENSKL